MGCRLWASLMGVPIRCRFEIWTESGLAVAAVFGRAVAVGPPSAICRRVRRRVGPGGLGGAWRGNRRGPSGSASLSPSRATLRVAIRVHDWVALVPEAGGGVPGSDTVSMVDWLATSRPQHPMAVLQGSPAGYEGVVQAHRTHGRGDGVG